MCAVILFVTHVLLLYLPLTWILFKKWAIPRLFLFIFGLFQANINTVLQQTNVKKCPSSIWHWDSNP